MRLEYRRAIESQARYLLRSGQARTWLPAKAMADEAFHCNAHTRTGGQCRGRPLPGRRQCGHRGGATPPLTEETKAFLRAKAATQPRIRGRFVRLKTRSSCLWDSGYA
jgi:hypothetical protein